MFISPLYPLIVFSLLVGEFLRDEFLNSNKGTWEDVNLRELYPQLSAQFDYRYFRQLPN